MASLILYVCFVVVLCSSTLADLFGDSGLVGNSQLIAQYPSSSSYAGGVIPYGSYISPAYTQESTYGISYPQYTAGTYGSSGGLQPYVCCGLTYGSNYGSGYSSYQSAQPQNYYPQLSYSTSAPIQQYPTYSSVQTYGYNPVVVPYSGGVTPYNPGAHFCVPVCPDNYNINNGGVSGYGITPVSYGSTYALAPQSSYITTGTNTLSFGGYPGSFFSGQGFPRRSSASKANSIRASGFAAEKKTKA